LSVRREGRRVLSDMKGLSMAQSSSMGSLLQTLDVALEFHGRLPTISSSRCLCEVARSSECRGKLWGARAAAGLTEGDDVRMRRAVSVRFLCRVNRRGGIQASL
jgi:hypothetical protein